jgi:hypothetical protein
MLTETPPNSTGRLGDLNSAEAQEADDVVHPIIDAGANETDGAGDGAGTINPTSPAARPSTSGGDGDTVGLGLALTTEALLAPVRNNTAFDAADTSLV